MAEAPSTPLRSLQPGAGDDLKRTPGGVSMDIVLTPALRPPPLSKYVQCLCYSRQHISNLSNYFVQLLLRSEK